MFLLFFKNISGSVVVKSGFYTTRPLDSMSVAFFSLLHCKHDCSKEKLKRGYIKKIAWTFYQPLTSVQNHCRNKHYKFIFKDASNI